MTATVSGTGLLGSSLVVSTGTLGGPVYPSAFATPKLNVPAALTNVSATSWPRFPVARQPRIIAEKEGTIAEKERAIAEKEKQLFEKDRTISELKRENDRLQALLCGSPISEQMPVNRFQSQKPMESIVQ